MLARVSVLTPSSNSWALLLHPTSFFFEVTVYIVSSIKMLLESVVLILSSSYKKDLPYLAPVVF